MAQMTTLADFFAKAAEPIEGLAFDAVEQARDEDGVLRPTSFVLTMLTGNGEYEAFKLDERQFNTLLRQMNAQV